MDTKILGDIIIILGLITAVILIFLRLKVPAIIGFILTGILAGPQGFGLIGASDVGFVAELGIVLLLFSIGIEFSIKDLLEIRRSILIGGSLQVGATLAITYATCSFFGVGHAEALLIGLLVSMSSTAIVLKMLEERAEISSPHGKNAFSILIFQDLLVVPAMILIPVMAGGHPGSREPMWVFLSKAGGFIIFLYTAYRWIVPQLLFQIARTRSRELFLISVILICLGVAWLTSFLGLSLALGAFLAGLIISESEYAQEALGRTLPFRDVFLSLFFISIGMLLDLAFLLDHLLIILGFVVLIIMLKTLTGSFSTLLLGYPLRTAVLVGFSLAQVGEFSFILSKSSLEHGILGTNDYQTLLGIALITMAITPFIMKMAPQLADLSVRLPFSQRIKSGLRPLKIVPDAEQAVKKKDHLVIIGYGVNGRNVSRAAKLADIPYVIIEMNPETVRVERIKGEPIYYGDATQEAILEHIDIQDAHVMVITIPDVAAARRVTELARRLNPALHIIARTRYLKEVAPLYELGADEVIPEEFETSIEIFSRALSEYLIPRDDIERFISELRSSGYEMLRSLSKEATTVCSIEKDLPDFKVSTFKVHQDSDVAGKSLAELQIRKKYRASILAIRRGSETIINPGGEDILYPDDHIILSGDIDSILSIMPLFRSKTRVPKDLGQTGI
jgi:CPA2 family monovalent cation:H+ antiporter-2